MEYVELTCFIIITLIMFYYIILILIDITKHIIKFLRKWFKIKK